MAFPLLGLVTGVVSFWKAKQEARIQLFKAVGDFVVTHWRFILVLAVVILGLVKLNALINEKKHWENLYLSLEQTIYKANAERDDALAKLKARGLQDVALIKIQHQSDMAKIIGKANHEKTISDRAINNYRDGLRLAIERETKIRTGLSGDDTDRSAGENSDTTIIRQQEYIKTLEDAGAACAADYNYCRDYVIKEQARIGVEKTE